LCANVLLQRLMPAGSIVRRSFSFTRREKGIVKRWYRNWIDWQLARRHKVRDYFFSLPPLTPEERLHKIYALARHSVVEVETHPVNPLEYKYLEGGGIFRHLGDVRLARPATNVAS